MSKNRLYCGLRWLSGPDRFVFWSSVGLTAAPIAAFMLFEGPWMWSWFSPAIPIVLAWLYVTCLALHLRCAFSDPGIVPRRRERPGVEANPFRNPPMVKTVTLRGEKVQIKYCQSCNVYRPPRSVHCGVCDNCVDRFDHHCPWTGNCVGRRNYHTFLWMVLLFVIMDLFTCFVLVAKIIVLSRNSPNSGVWAFWEAVTVDPAAPIIILYGLVFTVFQGILLQYHLQLCWINETTNENKKDVFRGKVNPYRLRNGFVNVFHKFFGPVLVRYVKFHEVAQRDGEENAEEELLSDLHEGDEAWEVMATMDLSDSRGGVTAELLKL